jgi:hypothetical protein
MRWTDHRPFVRPAVLDRRRLRRAALRYAEHGWPVTPGARLTGHRFACGRPGCPIMACHPALDSWEETAGAEAARVRAWWRHEPYSVLLVTGRSFDALEVPAALGVRALGAVRLHRRPDAHGPVAVTAAGRWIFLVTPGRPLRSELDRRLDVVHHGLGSWVPAAPSRMLEGPVRWAVPPEQARWRLPDAEVVQARLADALGAVRAPQLTVPRQMSTARRGG